MKYKMHQRSKADKRRDKTIKELRSALKDVTDYVQGKPLGIMVRNDGEHTYQTTGKMLGEIIENATKLL